MRRINIGGGVVVTADGARELNDLPTRVHHAAPEPKGSTA
jgi:hypothetical protein